MTLQKMQDNLRLLIRTRIEQGQITGTTLSREAGFEQGHLSNFLNARRGLSLESMDRLLSSLGIGILDLVDVAEIQQRVLPERHAGEFETVALVAEQYAIQPQFTPGHVLQRRSFRSSFLHKLRPNMAVDRSDWLRFVLLNVKREALGNVLPSERSTATLLIDRHYSSLEPYRRSQPNLYLVRAQKRCVIGYVTMLQEHLVISPMLPRTPAEVIAIAHRQNRYESIIGRVCQISLEV